MSDGASDLSGPTRFFSTSSSSSSSCRFFPCVLLPLLFVAGQVVSTGATLVRDKEVLLDLKSFLQGKNRVNQGLYAQWNESDASPCRWCGVTCEGGRVTRLYLNDSSISGELYHSFSSLTALTHLDLSRNTLKDPIPADLNQCGTLKYLNLSHNIITGGFNFPGLTSLESLDLTLNRLNGTIQANFPSICANLVTLNISTNNFSGDITRTFDECRSLKHLDISSNSFWGSIWRGTSDLLEFSGSENNLTGALPADLFPPDCSLQVFDVSQNQLFGEVPSSVANCRNLTCLSLSGNGFYGPIPPSFGSLQMLEGLYLGKNRFNRDVPEELANCSSLAFLDLSKNNFTGAIQPVFGYFTQVKFLVLHTNAFTDGIDSSGILKLPKVERLDLSFNNFTCPLPTGVIRMPRLKYLNLAFNKFSGRIPPEYGNMSYLQALDLSYNSLTGPIPASVGQMTSLLWLMLANNSLTGEIPPSIGNCRSLLWLNLANNQLTGGIPKSISEIGKDPHATFAANRRDDRVTAGSGECLSMRRWIPADYPPFSFAFKIMTRKSCRSTWDRLLKGSGIVPICLQNSSSEARAFTISGYVLLSGNFLSGEIPPEIGQMGNFTLIHLDRNNLSGGLPPQISRLPLNALNVSRNKLSGPIPTELGSITCLRNLDLSYNNFSGQLPASLNKLSELSKFNVSYNRFLSGAVPSTGQMATFVEDSFIGDPLIEFPVKSHSKSTAPPPSPASRNRSSSRTKGMAAFYAFIGLTAVFFISVLLSLVIRTITRASTSQSNDLLASEDWSWKQDLQETAPSPSISTASTSSSAVKVFHLSKTAFTYADIVAATSSFSESNVIGRGGFGTVYFGLLPDGRPVAVKKLQREGTEGEREFMAEMEVLTLGGGGWPPHPNLVALYGWCLYGSEKLLVYEHMEGGSLDDLITNWEKLPWKRRLEVGIGVARALIFLHHECSPSVVHRDVKASNVLLDGSGNARVTDFGLARVVADEDSHVSTVVAGTVGYVAPEYGQTWKATTKGDVYSFGVLLMELATGRRALEGGEEGCLVEWVRRVGREGWAEAAAAKAGRGETEERWEMMRVGLWCTAEAPSLRPNMKEALFLLMKIGGVGFQEEQKLVDGV